MGNVSEADRVLEELPRQCPPPQEGQARLVYRPVEVYDQADRPWPGTIIAWWTSPDGVETCCLRLSGVPAARWIVFDPDRVVPLVQGGT